MGFIDEIKAKAKTCKKTIVLPETEDIRTYEAAEAVLKEGTANLILVGSEEEIAKNKGDFDISGAKIVDPATYEKTEEYIAKLVELRQKKGMTEEQARELLLTNYLYYGVMMVKMKDADGMVSGACHSTADTLTVNGEVQSYTATLTNANNMKQVQVGQTVYSSFPANIPINANTTIACSGEDDKTITIDYTNTSTPVITNT